MIFRRWRLFLLTILVLAQLMHQCHADEWAGLEGQRIYFSGHSFHFFMPPVLGDLAKNAGIKEHTTLGLSAIGGSRVWQHWATAAATIASSSDLTLPVDTLRVVSTKRFPSAGTLTISTATGPVAVTYTGKSATAFMGCRGGEGSIGGMLNVRSDTNEARELLKRGEVDVFTMAPIFLPDDGIEKFVKLAIENNPRIRLFVQENWLPWDHYDPLPRAPFRAPGKVDHNAQTVESLRKSHAAYWMTIDKHVTQLNTTYDTTAVRVAPVGQAVVILRERILAGDSPGLREQNDLFTDEIGHAKAPLQALVAYCYFALVYAKSPIGLPVPTILQNARDKERLNQLLQEIAWDAVTSHPQSGVQRK